MAVATFFVLSILFLSTYENIRNKILNYELFRSIFATK